MSEQSTEPGTQGGWGGAPPTPAGDATGSASTAASAAAASASAAASAATEAFRTRLGVAEQVAVAGAALVVLVELVTGMVLQEYWAGDVAFLLGLAVLTAAYLRHVRSGAVPLGYANVIRVAGFAIAALAVVDLVYEVRRGVFDNAIDILGGAGYYLGAVLMAMGAFRIGDD